MSRARRRKNKKINSAGKISIIAVLITSLVFGVWFYAGWPRIPLTNFPPEIQEAKAADVRIFITSTATTTFTVPTDWNSASNTIEVIGGGGGGTGVAAGGSPPGGGGGGGAYAKIINATLTAGGTVGIGVGAGGAGGSGAANGTAGGDAWLCNSTANCATIGGTAVIVGAKGGGGGTGATGGAGGATSTSVGTTRNRGGTGGSDGLSDGAGGGGGAGGTTAAGSNGANGSSVTGGAGGAGGAASGGAGGASSGETCPTPAGAGGAGTVWDVTHGAGGGGGGGGFGDNSATCNGGAGGNYGGGGGGAGGTPVAAASGGAGQQSLIVVTYTPSAPGPTISCSTNITSTDFGALTTASITTSSPHASTTMSCSGTTSGCTLYVKDAGNGTNPGLATTSPAYLIPSPAAGFPATTTLSIGVEGYGIQATTTVAGLTIDARYNWATSTNIVGGFALTNQRIASSTADISGAVVIVTHKAAISDLSIAAKYADTITYECVVN